MRRYIVGAGLLLLVVIVCGALIWFNFFRQGMIAQYFAHFPVPTVTVSTVEVKTQRWMPGIDAIGTVSAISGVDVSGQASGVVESINFKANDRVNSGKCWFNSMTRSHAPVWLRPNRPSPSSRTP